MEYTTFGSTGTTVSEICLGCMSFGTDWDDWTLDRDESRELIERAIDLGINFFDTANVYSYGESEEILGEVLAEYDRDEMVVATKVYGQMRDDDPNSGGLSRKAIEQELDNSLERLGMDTVDLYQIHRWDYDTPIEQTLRALDDAVRRGTVRHVGASSMWAYQFADALHTSDSLGLDRFVSMQNLYNLAYREEEREMLPLCEKEDIAVMPWSPMAAGFLTRPHEEFEATTRGEHEADVGRPYGEGGGPAVNERVQELADENGVKMAQIALAWQFHKEWVTTPIVGTSSIEHLEDAVEALDIKLSDSDIEYLEEPYQPVRISGHE
ncbi:MULTISPECIES: aldo/keto reductase [Haloferax]|uniref:Aldo/keto reductase n=1 Tax=Haloferax marinum TaxID=2666143 RepID=A0A6A8G7Z2_9EURY|nr:MULTISPECIES: aldo/keto reductase [Haloferax]KAB1198303.1 aldo/keto reductase [Haloferax sp. CBA1150]MRW97400.1 aldo/keto reductase [Haloferax marinum]